jgi:hypothetical protein
MNVLGGYWGNAISNNALGATIAGGGENAGSVLLGFTSLPNVVTGDFGTGGGGYGNSAGNSSTVPGGFGNSAGGIGSFAAGEDAQTTNDNTFIWSDGSQNPFTGANFDNGFNVLASGGVFFFNGSEGVHVDYLNQNTNSIYYGLRFGAGASGEGIASERVAGANLHGLDFYTAFVDQMSLNNSGNLMLNGNDLRLLGVNSSSPGPTYAYGLGYRTSVAGISPSGGDGPFLYGFDAGYLGTRDPDAVALTWDWHGNVWVSNNCSVASLTIRGGADLAEPFRISNRQNEVPKGSVMVIDEKNPGQLKISDRPYDTRVAGVLSGANGINPGIQMQQQGLMEGDRNVALSGRVYVLADSANGAIQPGDLLTTSATPGYAMKVTNHSKAEGAILGKAMTSLNNGKGMVLVLVTLQ